MAAAISLTILCGVAAAALFACEWARWRLGKRVTKTIASASFVAVPLVAGASLEQTYVIFVVAGLALGAAGDVALLGESRESLATGIVFFLGGHIAYLIAFVPRGEMTAAVAVAGAVATAIGCAAGAYVWSSAGKLRPAVVVYIIVLVAMVTAASAATGPRSALIGAGGALFFCSDLAVARQRFRRESLVNKMLGLPTYYGAQLLIAWSCS